MRFSIGMKIKKTWNTILNRYSLCIYKQYDLRLYDLIDLMTILYSNRHHTLTADLDAPFRQQSDFLYHTGIDQPWYRAIIDEDDLLIFTPEIDEKTKLRIGEWLTHEQILAQRPQGQLYPLSARDKILRQLYRASDILQHNLDYCNTDSKDEKEKLLTLLDITADKLVPLDRGYRAIKSPEEIMKIQHAQRITLEAIEFATADLKAGMKEYEIAAKLSYYYASHGYSDAFPPIVASGINACTLHYTANSGTIQEWDLLLIDTGAYVDGYCGDCSRTTICPPSEGFNSNEERGGGEAGGLIPLEKAALKEVPLGWGRGDHIANQLLSIVQSVHDNCSSYARPGITLKELHQYAIQCFEKRFEDYWLERKKEYFPHSIGHSIGLDVHDPLDKDRPLETGMVITIEPGIYIRDLGIGIRWENIVLITDHWSEVLGLK